MECYLELARGTPLDFLHREYFPQGFPAKLHCAGLPERFKRSCGTVFWKLDVTLMSALQRRALLNYYHYAVTTHRTDWTPLLNLTPGLAEEAGLENVLTSVLSAEPPNAAVGFVEGVLGIADWCIDQSFWAMWLKRFLHKQLQEELAAVESKQQQLAGSTVMPPLLKRPLEPVLTDWDNFNHAPPNF